jgi:hypothetical protein
MLSPSQQRLAGGVLLLSPFLPLLVMGEEYGEQHAWPFFCSFNDEALIEAVRCGRRAEFADFRWPDSLPDPQAESTFQSARLRWNWPDGSWHKGLRAWYRSLLHVRRDWLPLRDFVNCTAHWYDRSDDGAGTPILPSDSVGQQPESESAPVLARPNGILELIRGHRTLGDSASIVAFFNFSDRDQDCAGTGFEPIGESNWHPVLSSEWPQYGGRHRDIRCPPRIDGSWRLLPHEVLVLSSIRREAL